MVPETAERFNLDAWAQRWDKEIEQWFQDPVAFWKGHPLFSCYNGSGKCEIKADYLPEPYLGDPCPSKGRHSAVFLNLNPGPPDDIFQAYPCGKYTARVRKVGYREWAKNNPYNPLTNKDEINTIYEQVHVGGENFWGNRNRWLSDVTGEHQPQPPFCLEIFPFHSDRWGYYNEEKAREWITEWVLKPAVSLSKRAEIPAVICVGKSFKRLLEVMGLENDTFIGSGSGEFPGNWPMKAPGKPMNRTFLRFKGLGGTFFVTYHSGGNKLPGHQFREICLNILSRQ